MSRSTCPVRDRLTVELLPRTGPPEDLSVAFRQMLRHRLLSARINRECTEGPDRPKLFAVEFLAGRRLLGFLGCHGNPPLIERDK